MKEFQNILLISDPPLRRKSHASGLNEGRDAPLTHDHSHSLAFNVKVPSQERSQCHAPLVVIPIKAGGLRLKEPSFTA